MNTLTNHTHLTKPCDFKPLLSLLLIALSLAGCHQTSASFLGLDDNPPEVAVAMRLTFNPQPHAESLTVEVVNCGSKDITLDKAMLLGLNIGAKNPKGQYITKQTNSSMINQTTSTIVTLKTNQSISRKVDLRKAFQQVSITRQLMSNDAGCLQSAAIDTCTIPANQTIKSVTITYDARDRQMLKQLLTTTTTYELPPSFFTGPMNLEADAHSPTQVIYKTYNGYEWSTQASWPTISNLMNTND